MTSQSLAAGWSQREWPNARVFLHCAVEFLAAQDSRCDAFILFSGYVQQTWVVRGIPSPPSSPRRIYLDGVSAVGFDDALEASVRVIARTKHRATSMDVRSSSPLLRRIICSIQRSGLVKLLPSQR